MRLAENKVENISDGLILSHPKYGWATVNLNGFKGRVSYLNDIAFDWLKALKVAIENNTVATLYGDEEGSCFYIVLDNYYGFVIVNRDKLETIEIDYGLIDFAQELCDAIRTDLKGWARFCDYDYYDLSEDEKKKKDLELCQLIADTEEAIRNARRNNY